MKDGTARTARGEGTSARGLRAALGVVVVVALTAVVAACGASDKAPSGAADRSQSTTPPPLPVTGGQLAVGLASETDSFLPSTGTWGNSAYIVANAIYDPLTAFDEQGIAKPYLAESVLPTPDFRSWTIKVRSGVQFHDGEPLDANAVKKNLDAARTSGLTSAALTAIDSIDIVDPLTVVVRMNKAWATFPATLTVQIGYMAAPKTLDDPTAGKSEPIGTGPFQFKSRVRDSNIVVKRNPSYWRKDTRGVQLPYLEGIEFKIVTDSTSRKATFSAGDVQAFETWNATGVADAIATAKAGNGQVITNEHQPTDEIVLAFNTTKEPFNDPIARQALAYGISQDELVAQASESKEPGAWGLFSQDEPYYISKAEAGYPELDRDKARELVKQYEQAHGKPLEFTSVIRADNESLRISQAFQAQAAQLGIKINIDSTDQATLIKRVIVSGDYQAAGFVLFSSPIPDQAATFIATKSNPNGLSLNFTRYDDPEIVTAIDEYRAASDPQQRIEVFKKVQKRLAADLQFLFLSFVRGAFLSANNVHGLESTTYPGTDKPAFVPFKTSPFFTETWLEQQK